MFYFYAKATKYAVYRVLPKPWRPRVALALVARRHSSLATARAVAQGGLARYCRFDTFILI